MKGKMVDSAEASRIHHLCLCTVPPHEQRIIITCLALNISNCPNTMVSNNLKILVFLGSLCVISIAFQFFNDRVTTSKIEHRTDYATGDGDRTLTDNSFLCAVERKDFLSVKSKLLADKSVVNETDGNGQNALHIIAKRGHYQYPPNEIPLHLIQNGINISLKDGEGNTPLVISLLSGWQKIAILLLDSGAEHSSVTPDVISRIKCPDSKRVVRQYGL